MAKFLFQKGNTFGNRFKKGYTPWNKGGTSWNKGIPNTWYNPKGLKIGWKLQKRFVKGQIAPMKGRPNLKIRGENHWRWNGGSNERHLLMGQLEYKLWRKAVFERNNYTCRICLKRGGYLEADHIKPWALFPELRYAIDNGRTLCKICHRQTDTFGINAKKERITYGISC